MFNTRVNKNMFFCLIYFYLEEYKCKEMEIKEQVENQSHDAADTQVLRSPPKLMTSSII